MFDSVINFITGKLGKALIIVISVAVMGFLYDLLPPEAQKQFLERQGQPVEEKISRLTCEAKTHPERGVYLDCIRVPLV